MIVFSLSLGLFRDLSDKYVTWRFILRLMEEMNYDINLKITHIWLAIYNVTMGDCNGWLQWVVTMGGLMGNTKV